jgi:hypothetical protein
MNDEQTLCALITIAAWTGEVSGTHLYDPGGMYGRGGHTEFRSGLRRALPDLAEGGYVIDLRPLANRPEIRLWQFQAPLPNGDIEGDAIGLFSDEARESAAQMQPFLSGEFGVLAGLMAQKAGEPGDGAAGPFDYVSAAYLARYWEARGARVGRRVGNVLRWRDGEAQEILPGS